MPTASQHQLPHDQNSQLAEEVKRTYAALREKQDVIRVTFPFGGDGWMTMKYELTRAFYNDPRFGKEPMLSMGDYPRIRQQELSAKPTFLAYDGAKHQEKRRVIMKYMTLKRVHTMRPEIEQIISSTLDDFELGGSPGEMSATFTRLAPLKILCAFFGTPTIEDADFLAACDVLSPSGTMSIEEAAAAQKVISRYFREVVEEKKKNPDDRLISSLLRDTEAGSWSDEEMMGVGQILLAAAHESTGNTLTAILEWLSYEPDLYAQLRAEPEMIPRAMEEFYRAATGGIGVPQGRIALEDVELGGVQIKAGEAVAGNVVASHFDPDAYPNPNELDFNRESPKPHMFFGAGPHSCVGSQLARLEINVAMETILSRYKTFINVEPSENWLARRGLRGARKLHVMWERA